MALWDGYDDVTFRVVTNSRGQYSIWPATRPVPHGWSGSHFTGQYGACLEEAGKRWASADRPASRPHPDEDDRSGRTITASITVRSAESRESAEEASFLKGAVRPTPDISITSLIQAADIPSDLPAAHCGSARITRRELLDTSTAWARVLAAFGCGREVPVALLLPRGLDALTAILAVLDAGGAYVPLSYDDPPERVHAILEDCGAPIVITTDDFPAMPDSYSGRVLTLSRLAELAQDASAVPQPASGDDLAYIFYTSGTMGEPKGVEGTHRQLVNYALWCRSAFMHAPDETTFLSASLFFLGSLTTIFTPLLEGWPITVAPHGATTDDLLDLSRRSNGGLLKLTPTHIRMMMARDIPQQGLARQLMVGSEPLTFTRELKQWMAADPRRVVVNHYGLTETHGCFCHWLTGEEQVGSRIPIGTPIDNVEAYIVDRDGELVDVGDIGELLIGGPSIGRGYRRRPELTAERWIPNPWGTDGSRLLRTRDLARREEDGTMTVLGRADRQVKIRGHRVEPAAVEEALRELANVREALVLPRVHDGTVTLDAFLLPEVGSDVDPVSVRDELTARLPPQWIPARMAVMSEFPANANGKVDTHALPEPIPVRPASSLDQGAERWTGLDRIVAGAFCDVLNIDSIGLSDNFYGLGGDSLTSVAVAARVGNAVGMDVPAPSARAATVRAYACSVGDAMAEAARGTSVKEPR